MALRRKKPVADGPADGERHPADGERHPVDEVMPIGPMIVYGLQHVMSMYAGVIAVPLIVGTALNLTFRDLAYLLTAALLVSGLATLLQTLGVWKIGSRLPLIQGTSFAAVASMLAIGKAHGGGPAGLTSIFGAILVAGVVGFLISGVFSRLLHFFPPVVTGTVIAVIGLSLLPVAIEWAGGGQPGQPGFGSMSNVGLAALTLVAILVIYRFLPGFFSRIAILLGLVVGTLIAWPMGKTDFSKIGQAPWVSISTPFHWGPPHFDLASIVSMLIVILVIMTETTADILAVGEVVGRPADEATVAGGLRADTLSTAVSGGLLNSFSASAFAQNVGLVAITGIKSRFVVATGGGILVLLGLIPKLGAIIAAIPQPVLGGVGLALFATVAASGIRALSRVEYEGNNNLVIVAVAIGIGIIPIAVPTFYDAFPAWFQTIFNSGISSSALVAVLLNILFNLHGRQGGEAAIFAEAPTVGVTPEYDVPGGVDAEHHPDRAGGTRRHEVE
jgi:uric acid transporter